MKPKKVNLFDVDVDALSMSETVDFIDNAIAGKKQLVHNCINANKVVLMETDSQLQHSLQEADIISADGQAVVWASKLFGLPLPERVPGIDLMENLMVRANDRGYSAFLFGAKEDVVEKVAKHYKSIWGDNVIAGFRNGYFSKEDETEIVNSINKSGAKLLFVAIPSPQKEIFIRNHRDALTSVFLLMGVGGSFDVISGNVERAPRWMQDSGLEWLFRLIQEPRKMWKRYLIGNCKYIYITFRRYFSKSIDDK